MNLPRRIASNNVLCDKTFDIAKNLNIKKYQMYIKDEYQRSCFTRGGAIKSKTISNQQLAKELHKPII